MPVIRSTAPPAVLFQIWFATSKVQSACSRSRAIFVMSLAMLIVNCNYHGWGFELAYLLEQTEPVELIDVDFGADKKPIEELSKIYGATFEHDPLTKTVRFRPISN
jgi:hypothetical protein